MAGEEKQPKKMKRPGWARAAQGDSQEEKPQAPTATLNRPAKHRKAPEAAGAPEKAATTASAPLQTEDRPVDARAFDPDAPSAAPAAGKKTKAPKNPLSGAWRKQVRGRQFFPATALGLLGLIIVVVFGFKACASFGAGSDDTAKSAPAPKKSVQKRAPDTMRRTDVSFSQLIKKGEKVSLKAGGLSWEGQVTSGEAGQTVTLKGPTAAQIRTGFELPRSHVDSGVFAVATDNGPVLHVVYHTFGSGETEITQGSIFSIQDNRLMQSGYYRDERDGGTNRVVRTYIVPGGKNYRVSFKAPEGAPIPLLVGYRGLK